MTASAAAAARNLDAVASLSNDLDLSSQSPNASRAGRVRKKTTSDLFLKNNSSVASFLLPHP
jgi:hypothetical protein